MANKNTNKNRADKRTAPPVKPEIDNMSDEDFEKYLDAQIIEDTPSAPAPSGEDSKNHDNKENENSRGGESAYAQESRHSYEDGGRRILERWFRDAQRLKQEVPDFDLDEAMKNEDFRNYVISGMSVDGAYYAVKYKELTKNQRRPIMQNASSRAVKRGSGMNDILNMNDGDFRKRLKSIMNGD